MCNPYGKREDETSDYRRYNEAVGFVGALFVRLTCCGSGSQEMVHWPDVIRVALSRAEKRDRVRFRATPVPNSQLQVAGARSTASDPLRHMTDVGGLSLFWKPCPRCLPRSVGHLSRKCKITLQF
jgi:hypothetical protein